MSISSMVSLAVGKIGELLVEEAKLLYGVEDQVRSLQDEFMMMQSFLIDMEAMDEEGGDERSRTTIKQIRKIAYDAEDVIESYVLEANSSFDKTESFFKRYFSFCTSLPRTHQVGSEIEAIMERLNITMERLNKYVGEIGVGIDARQGLKKTRVRMRSIAYPHTIEDHVVGLDEDINKLVGVLTSDEEHTKIKVVSIVGMGGSGKTTLARKLFNHETVKNHFDRVEWVSVSQQCVAQQILLELLQKFGEGNMRTDESPCSLQVLVEKLHQYLEGKRYLIVLDDVWEEKTLEDILPGFPFGSDGRKIIVTTRNKKFLDYPNLKPHTYPHEPRRLNEEESWELFRKIALIEREETNNSTDIAKLETFGKEMLKKCQGLPLAVIALAGILSQKATLEEWVKVKKAVGSRIMDDGKGTHLYGAVNEMLTLSYNDLSHELKPCFLYLACYREDEIISVGRLIQMWIAEGFFTSAKLHEGDTVEDVARRYMDELIHRCMIQVASRNDEEKVKTIQIHDLVRELCLKKAKQEGFLENFSSKSENADATLTESRRTAIYSYDGNLLPFPPKSPHLRSLIYEAGSKIEDNQKLSLEVIHQNFRLLRVLIFENIRNCDSRLPTGIGSLIHLRYLRLWGTSITELPSSIGKLRNLLTLDYRNSSEGVIRIPDVVWKIEGLRHLYLPSGRGGGAVETLKLHTLKYLQTLKVGIRKGNWMLEELPRLSPSVQKLNIRGITSQEQLGAAFQSPSIRLDRLHSLELEWHNDSEECDDEVVKVEDLEPIFHSQHLRKLILTGIMGDTRGLQFPTSIKKLVLVHTLLEAEATLVALGKLPQLTNLVLWEKAYMGTKWTCTAGEFPQLKELHMDGSENLEEWSIERGTMPQLRILAIWGCRRWRKLPEGFKFFTTLQELCIGYMSDELEERLKGGGEDAHIIQHVPYVKFRD